MIDTAGALTYFKTDNHLQGHRWASFSEAQQGAAIHQARRILSRILGDELDDAEAAYVEGDSYREEYAVYEQALWMLENSAFPNTQGTGPVYTAETPGTADNIRDSQKQYIAPEALRWLEIAPGQIRLERG